MDQKNIITSTARYLAIGLLTFLETPIIKAQVIYFTKYPAKADVKIHEVASESLADLVVFKVDNHRKQMGNGGKWEITKYPAQADWKVYVTSYPSQADIKVYYTRYPSRARWRKPEKKIEI